MNEKSDALRPVAGNGLLDRRAFLRGGAALAAFFAEIDAAVADAGESSAGLSCRSSSASPFQS